MSESDSPTLSYSVSFRLQRTTTETAFVSVPVTGDLMLPHPDGSFRLNGEQMAKRAIEMGLKQGLTWESESQQVDLHPIQIAPPAVLPDAQSSIEKP